MIKHIFIIFSLLIAGCNTNESFVDSLDPKFENLSFEVVQKKLIIDAELPDYVLSLTNKWFDQKVKINGFDGDLTLTISNFTQEISPVNDGKRVDISLSFNLLLNKPSASQKKFIEGEIFSYGTLTGNFSLNELDTVVKNTQSDLILRLSRDLELKN